MSGMAVQRVREGLWRWTVAHPEWRGATDWPEVVGSVYCETAEAIVVIDPMVPADDPEAKRFWGAFDADVGRLGLPVAVLLTCRWHVRSAASFRARHGARVFAPALRGHAFDDVVTDLVVDGAQVVPGVQAFLTGSPAPNEECVYVLTDARAAVVGDILVGDEVGGLRVADQAWYANTEAEVLWYRDELADGLDRLLDCDLEHVLVAHGAPVGPDPIQGLRSALARHRATRWT
jgi:glyoxylase-like metal-dependent hydrolase (beta-lactamase superfamily II)